MKVLTALVLSCLLFSTAFAQTDGPSLQQEKIVVLSDGTEIEAVTTETISSKNAHEDDSITFVVDHDVVVNGDVLIAKGTTVKGTVTGAKKAGYMGKAGNLNIRVDSTVCTDGQKIKLRASKGKEGGDKTGTTVALVVLFGPLGFLKHGSNAQIKAGTHLKVFTDEEKAVRVHGTQSTAAEKNGSVNPAPVTTSVPAQTVNAAVPAPVPASTPAVIQNDPPATTSIALKSMPEGADIEVDGMFMGNTPSTVQLKTGQHKIVVQKKGYATWERTIMLNAGGNIIVDVNLEKEAAPVTVTPGGNLSTQPLKR